MVCPPRVRRHATRHHETLFWQRCLTGEFFVIANPSIGAAAGAATLRGSTLHPCLTGGRLKTRHLINYRQLSSVESVKPPLFSALYLLILMIVQPFCIHTHDKLSHFLLNSRHGCAHRIVMYTVQGRVSTQ